MGLRGMNTSPKNAWRRCGSQFVHVRRTGTRTCPQLENMCNNRRRYAAVGAALLVRLSALCYSCGSATAWLFSVPIAQQPPRAFQRQRDRSRPNTLDGRHRTTMTATTSAGPATGSTSATATVADIEEDLRPSSTAIVGGGPTGLAVALMLARRGYRDITVLERLAEPPPPASEQWGNPGRSYNLGIGGRGQVALAKLGAADKVMSWCADAVVSSRGWLRACASVLG